MLYQNLPPEKRKGNNKYKHGDWYGYDDRPNPEDEDQKELRKKWEAREGGVAQGVCAYCGREFFQHRYYAADKYCSYRCRNDAYMERRRFRHELSLQKICTMCGEPYTATRSDSKYCSQACKQAAYRDRKRK